MARENEGGTSVILAFLLGAVSGATLGLLWAPKAGAEVRGQLKDFSRDTMEKSKACAQTMQEKAKNVMEKAKSTIQSCKEAVEEEACKATEDTVNPPTTTP